MAAELTKKKGIFFIKEEEGFSCPTFSSNVSHFSSASALFIIYLVRSFLCLFVLVCLHWAFLSALLWCCSAYSFAGIPSMSKSSYCSIQELSSLVPKLTKQN
jgi:hypothetical protein